LITKQPPHPGEHYQSELQRWTFDTDALLRSIQPIQIKASGTYTANGTTGVVTLCPQVATASIILLTVQVPGGTVGLNYIFSRSVGVSFTTKSAAADTSTVGWILI
jgi:hypothetical protein